MVTFEQLNLPISLKKAIDDLGFTTPTPIQAKAFPIVMSGRDVMGIAQTGTGKTFAYLLPILKQWKFVHTDIPRVLILVPTRELVVQVHEEIEKLTKYMSVRSLAVYGGVNINTQKKDIYSGIDIVVGTPGRIMDLALDNVLRFDDLFSATMTEEVDDLLDEFFEFPEEVSLAPSGTPLEQIEQRAYVVPNFLTKVNLLKHLLADESYSRILLFVNSKRMADFLLEHLEEDFPGQFGTVHSNKTQNYRLNMMENFQNGEIRGLVTTDIMARGLDITDITHVINMQFPEIPEQYMHRIGRTGRADKDGIAISFIGPKEDEFQLEVEMLMQTEIKIHEIPAGVKIEQQRLEFEKDQKKVKTLLKRVKKTGGDAFEKKSEKNSKVNLGGPGKRTPRKTASRNRGIERKRDEKKKKK